MTHPRRYLSLTGFDQYAVSFLFTSETSTFLYITKLFIVYTINKFVSRFMDIDNKCDFMKVSIYIRILENYFDTLTNYSSWKPRM